ncbi:hypothetical protein [Nocardioides ungokensis]|uniref:hypothetical protein n=1 Tax=Nocardioides ungokensis TaxID=1643322 RepID=UPI0015DE543F|nr:hypothetical protein [Nocardioides ungokensis]
MAGLAVGLVYVAANLPAAPASLPTAPAARGSHVDATLSSATTGSLSISPAKYVGGQRLTWSGSVGHAGVRPLVLQFNMGNATGNHWSTVDGFHDQTQADGSFSFTYPAPSMFNIRYRVKAGEYVVRGAGVQRQDPGPHHLGDRADGDQHQRPGAGGRRPDVRDHRRHHSGQHLPEPRVAGTPRAQGSNPHAAAADRRGHLAHPRHHDRGRRRPRYFTGLTAVAGVAVFRVRAEDYVTGGNQIGWAQSFPLYVLAGQTAQDWYSSLYGSVPNSSVPVNKGPSGGAQPPTSSQHYRWFPSLFDFAWEYGQSLSSPPSRGTRIQGSWTDSSTGSGRVSKFNGAAGAGQQEVRRGGSR